MTIGKKWIFKEGEQKILPTYDGRVDPVDRMKLYLRNNIWHLLRKLLYFCLAFTGCCYQIYFIADQFLAYHVITDLTIARPTNMTAPRLAVCLMARDTRLKDGNGPIGDLDNLHVNKLMDLTPLTPNVSSQMNLESGSFITLANMSFFNGSKGQLGLTGMKFFKREEMCFSYFPTVSNRTFDRDYMRANGMQYLYMIHVHNYWLQHMNLFRVFFYNNITKFYEKSDSALTVTRRRITGKNSKQKPIIDEVGKDGKTRSYLPMSPNEINVGYTQYNSFLLPTPYASKCHVYNGSDGNFYYGATSQAHCFDLCAHREFKGPGKDPPVLGKPYDPTELYNEKSELPLLTKNNLDKNPTFKTIIAQVEDKCKKRCSQSDCTRIEFVPRVVSQKDDTDGILTRLSVFIPTDPEISVKVKGILYMIDFITYCLSCVSFWLGFAPYGFLSNYDFITYVGDYIHIHIKKGHKGQEMIKGYITVKSEVEVRDRWEFLDGRRGRNNPFSKFVNSRQNAQAALQASNPGGTKVTKTKSGWGIDLFKKKNLTKKAAPTLAIKNPNSTFRQNMLLGLDPEKGFPSHSKEDVRGFDRIQY